MAPTKPRSKKARSKHKKRATADAGSRPIRQLLAETTALLEQGDAAAALQVARQAVDAAGNRHEAEARTLLGEVYLELADPDSARAQLLRAAEADVEEADAEDDGAWWDSLIQQQQHGGGSVGARAEKYLWLAQLSEDGGADSVRWLERGAAVLRRYLARLEDKAATAAGPHRKLAHEARADVARRLSSALCAVAEVYMTDLSWEADAEQRCDALVTEATMLAPDHAEAWQTVANVRISQGRVDEARAALARSMETWAAEDATAVPPFATRVSLARLLMEVEWEDRAVEVAERLVREDDESVEVLYLGGLGQFLLGEKMKKAAAAAAKDPPDQEWRGVWKSARRWLKQCMTLFAAQEYEDERLGQHAQELLGTLNQELGEAPDDEDDEDDDWEDEDDDGDADEVMS